jgi:isoleucyl-tRNA synthetase
LPSNVVLAKNLVGKHSKKGFASEDAADFENFKEGDKKIRFR